MKKTLIPAGKFKAMCLKIMETVKLEHVSYIITKHGKPVAMLVPCKTSDKPLHGHMATSATLHGNIIDAIDEPWDAMS
jgi:prevent-host-death family protein